jgi:hypothetical protein
MMDKKKKTLWSPKKNYFACDTIVAAPSFKLPDLLELKH